MIAKAADLISENFRIAGAIFIKKPEAPLFYERKQCLQVHGKIKDKNFGSTLRQKHSRLRASREDQSN
jgi:hypothetical protein